MAQRDEGKLNRSTSGEGEDNHLYGQAHFGGAEDGPVSAEAGNTDGNTSVGRTEEFAEPEDDQGFGIRRTEGSDERSDTEEFWRMSQL